MTTPEDAIIILGGSIIGGSIAYYVSRTQPRHKVYIVDPEDALFRSASGFSGGLIVRDWFSPAVLSLADLSFQLHRQLADAHDGRRKWGYSASTAFSLVQEEINVEGEKTGNVIRGEDWLLHGTSRAEASSQFASVPLQQRSSNTYDQDFLLRADNSPAWLAIQKGQKLECVSSDSGCAQVGAKGVVGIPPWACQRESGEGAPKYLSYIHQKRCIRQNGRT
jgi:hypothetical protein